MRQHSPDLIEITWALLGLAPIDFKPGLAEGAHIIPKRNAPNWTQLPDGVGGILRMRNPDRSGTLTINIDQESRTHQELITASNADDITLSITGPIVERDGNTRKVTTWTKAYIIVIPDVPRGTTSGIAAWVFNFESVFEQPFDFNANLVGP